MVAIQMVSEADGWAAGHYELYRWNGQEWKPAEIHSDDNSPFLEIHDFSMLSPTNIWATGYRVFIQADGNRVDGGGIVHWDGKAWNEVYRGPYTGASIKMIAENMGWAIGNYRPDVKPRDTAAGMIYYWDGKAWSEFKGENQLLYTICGYNERHMWIFGEKEALRLVKKIPTAIPSGPNLTITVPLTQTPKPRKLVEVTSTLTPSFTPTLQKNTGVQDNRPSLCPAAGLSVGLVTLALFFSRRKIKPGHGR